MLATPPHGGLLESSRLPLAVGSCEAGQCVCGTVQTCDAANVQICGISTGLWVLLESKF